MKIYSILAGVLLVASSCAEKSVVTGEKSELILSGQVSFDQTTTPAASKVDMQPLPETNLGVYVLTVSGDAQTDLSTTTWKNQLFHSDASGMITGGDVTLRTGTTYDIYSYAPRVDAVGDEHSIPVRHGDDVLWAHTPSVVATAGGTKAQLAFTHCGAQIAFRLVPGTAVTDVSGASLEVGGFYKSGTLDVETGNITVSDPTQTVTLSDGTPTNILVPGSGSTMTFTVTVTNVPGYSQTFTGSFSRELVAGKSYLYDVTVNSNVGDVTVTGQLVDWTDVDVTEFPLVD